MSRHLYTAQNCTPAQHTTGMGLLGSCAGAREPREHTADARRVHHACLPALKEKAEIRPRMLRRAALLRSIHVYIVIVSNESSAEARTSVRPDREGRQSLPSKKAPANSRSC